MKTTNLRDELRRRISKMGQLVALFLSLLSFTGVSASFAQGTGQVLPQAAESPAVPDEASKVIEDTQNAVQDKDSGSSAVTPSAQVQKSDAGQLSSPAAADSSQASSNGTAQDQDKQQFTDKKSNAVSKEDDGPQVATPIPDKPGKNKDEAAESAEAQEDSETDKAELSDTGESQPADIDPVPHYNLAVSLTKEKKYKEALDELHKALEMNPSYMQARYQVAFVNQLMGKDKIAVKEYKRYLRIKPEDVLAHVNLGTLLKAIKDLDGAEAEYRTAIDVNFYSFTAHYDLANLLVERDRLEEAQKEYKICLRLQPRNAMVHNNLGVIYQRRHYLEEADEEFTKALRLEPENKIFHTNVALVRDQIKKNPGM